MKEIIKVFIEMFPIDPISIFGVGTGIDEKKVYFNSTTPVVVDYGPENEYHYSVILKLDIDKYKNTEDKTTIWYYQYMLDNNMVPDKSDPFFSLLTQLYRLKMDKPENRTEIALLTARLEGKNPDPNEMKGTRAFLLLASNMKYILIISALILGVSVITDDNLKGNIYQYMTFPFTRKKKIFAKYIATMMLLFIVLIFWILITFATAFITWGKGDINLAYIYAFNSHAFTMSFVSYILVLYSAIFLEILIFQFISMLIAVASKSAYISVFTVLAAYFLKANMSIVVKRLIGPNSKMLLFFQNTDVVNGVECMFRNKISSLSLLILFVLGLASFVGAYYIYEEVDW